MVVFCMKHTLTYFYAYTTIGYWTLAQKRVVQGSYKYIQRKGYVGHWRQRIQQNNISNSKAIWVWQVHQNWTALRTFVQSCFFCYYMHVQPLHAAEAVVSVQSSLFCMYSIKILGRMGAPAQHGWWLRKRKKLLARRGHWRLSCVAGVGAS